MEFKSSEPGEGENITYSYTPDGHERAGRRPAAVAGSDSGTVLRSVPASLSGASAAGRARPRVGFSGQAPATATPPGTVTFGALSVAGGSKQQLGDLGVAADAQDPAAAGEGSFTTTFPFVSGRIPCRDPLHVSRTVRRQTDKRVT